MKEKRKLMYILLISAATACALKISNTLTFEFTIMYLLFINAWMQFSKE